MTAVSRSTRVDAPAARTWEVLSDLPSMGERSPENTGGRWAGGATGPAVGARFEGSNQRGRHRWSTVATVVRCEPGAQLAFEVSSLGLAVAEWSYVVSPDGPGACTVTETWTDRRGALMRAVGPLVTGVRDREAFTATSIEQTLAAVKARAEQG